MIPSLQVLIDRLTTLRRSSLRLGYIGAPHDSRNLGDSIMRRTADRLLAPATLVDVTHPATERRLEAVRLAGAAYFDAVVLGGGTLIQPISAPLVRTLLDQGVPLFTLGSGVGSWGYGMTEDVDLTEWGDLLAKFEFVGLRGPLSQERLEKATRLRCEVIGDLALFETRDRLEVQTSPPRLALNVLAPEDGRPPGDHPVHRAVGRLVKHLVGRGWDVLPIAMDTHDLAPLEATLALSGASGPRPLQPGSAAEVQHLLASCQLTIAFRLHAAVMSVTVGTPPLSIGYRSKCLDFMRSVDLGDWHVSLVDHETVEDEILEVGERLVDVAPSLRCDVHAHALQRRRALERAAAELLVKASSRRGRSGDGRA